MNTTNTKQVEFKEYLNGELVNSHTFGIERYIGKTGKLYYNDTPIGDWEAKAVNIRIGRSGTKVHRGIVYEGVLEQDARVSDGYGFTRLRRAGETIRMEPKNLCGAGSNPRGGGRYVNWQGDTTDEVDCKYCLREMAN